jgi:alpha-glucosidase (family GH31 glycosyl hydrolase)
MYSQFFLISLNEKGSFFKPLMFEFPDDGASYENIEDKIMVGEAFLLCAFYKNNLNSKKFLFPNENFNSYPSGKSIVNYDDTENAKSKIIELSGKLEDIHIFLRGGFIVPYQNVFDNYILNSHRLRDEKINLIVNLDHNNNSRGEIFYDNDDIDPIKNNTYNRVEMYFNDKKVVFNTYKNNLNKYEYNDHILGKIEFWRISNIIKINDVKGDKTPIINLNITYNDNKKKEDIVEGIYEKENDKAIFEISQGDKTVSIFDINEMVLLK